MAATVMLVEDERKLRDLVRSYLERAGFTVLSTGSGAEAIMMASSAAPDLIVLDLGLPDVPGETVASELRALAPTPIVMLTAKSAEEDRIRGLELGADDYVTKPFSHRELVARMRAVLRRGQDAELMPDVIEAAGVRMDVERHEVSVNGDRIKLALKEFELLEILLRNAGRVMTRGQLIDRIWGADYVGDTKTLDVHVKRLRTKIEPDPADPRYLITVRGLGYKFEA